MKLAHVEAHYSGTVESHKEQILKDEKNDPLHTGNNNLTIAFS